MVRRKGSDAMPAHPTLWIAIADGEHARLVTRAADNALHTQSSLVSPAAHQQTSDLVSDRAGRSFESASPTRHAITPRTDPHEKAQLAFAHQVAAAINAGSFDQLVLVAQPDILHAIQNHLDKPTRARVTGTLMKNLVKVPDHELQPHLAQWVHPIVRKA